MRYESFVEEDLRNLRRNNVSSYDKSRKMSVLVDYRCNKSVLFPFYR